MTLENRQISLPQKTWAIIDSMSESRDLSPSELLNSMIQKLANFEPITFDFNAPVKAVSIGGDTIVGDKVGGNVNRSQNQTQNVNVGGNIHGDVTSNSTANFRCDTIKIVLPNGADQTLHVNGQPVTFSLGEQEACSIKRVQKIEEQSDNA